jgi:hypothetical protein
MAGIDLNEDYAKTSERIKSLDTYNQVTQGTQQILSQQQSSLEQDVTNTASQLSQLQEQKKRYQRQVTSQLEKLLDLNTLLPNNRVSGQTVSSTTSLIKNQFTEALNGLKSKIPQIIVDEMLSQLGCSQEQTYDTNLFTGGIYVPVESIDLFGTLKLAPDTTVGKLTYESSKITIQNSPFSMNQELYERIQNENVSYSDSYGQNYLGSSRQGLFDITYVTKDGNGNNGNFFKVNLMNRADNLNLISQFMVDYFNSIEIVNTKNIFLQLFQILFGAVSIDLKMGSGEIEDGEYFQKILTRILGLCFDERNEIDVSGNAKVAPLDGVDETFFELTDIDLREIESNLSNIQRGVIEYQDCTTVKLPVDTQAIFNNLLQILDLDENNSAATTALLNQTVDSVKGNTQWPQIDSIGIKIDNEIIKSLPRALYSAVLSPKVLLPFMVMYKALETALNVGVQSAVNEVYNLKTFLNVFKKMNVQIMSKIGAEFVKILRNIIVRDVRRLLQVVSRDLQKSAVTKKYAIIAQLIELTILITQFVDDYRKCKSVIADILNIIEFALRGTNIQIPPFLLPLASLRSGFNSVRATLQVIQNFQALGIPTGPMPDGSPNLFMIAQQSAITGVESERDKNSKIAGLTPQQIVLPIGITIPVPFTGIPL